MALKTHRHGEESVIEQLKKRGFIVTRDTCGILVNNFRIQTKSCNSDNLWAQKVNAFGGWDKINPEKFDYLVCTVFDTTGKDVRYLIFSKQEAEKFNKIFWKGAPNLKNLTLIKGEKQTEEIIKLSENRWDKIPPR